MGLGEFKTKSQITRITWMVWGFYFMKSIIRLILGSVAENLQMGNFAENLFIKQVIWKILANISPRKLEFR